MRRLVFVVAVVAPLIGWAVSARSQGVAASRIQLKCNQRIDKNASLLSKTKAKQVRSCVQLAQRGSIGNPPLFENCLSIDLNGALAGARLKGIGGEIKACVPPGGLPAFGVPVLAGPYLPPAVLASYDVLAHRVYTEPVSSAAAGGGTSLAGELFGADIDGAVLASKTAASSCQYAILKAVQKCEAKKRKLYTHCKKDGISAAAVNGTATLRANCFIAGNNLTGNLAAQAKVDGACQVKLIKVLGKSCPGANLGSLFPGACAEASSASSFGDCVAERINCRYCQQVNVTDDLGKDCDLFDDGLDNDSCSDTLGFCGDGILDPAYEACDDGNNDDGDCCSAECTLEAEGSSCGDSNDDQCTNPDSCNATGDCLPNDEPDTSACGDDGNDCTNDLCDGGGACGHPNKISGSACGNGTDSDCTNPDSCNGSGVCSNNHEPSGTGCTSDDNVCTDDQCDGGGSCGHLNNTAACDDSVFCNGAETCSAGTCSVHAGDPCSGPDGDGNCAETCDESADNCNGNDVDGSSCTDGQFCTGTETCSAGVCGSATGDPCVGPDGDGDCAESCDEGGDTCTGPDSGGAACADDGNPCTSDSCDGSGACIHPNLTAGAACGDATDGDCTDPDTCDGSGACLSNHETGGTPCTSDDNVCTDDQCDAGGSCQHPNNTAPCDDGLHCTGSETCSGGSCAIHSGDPCGGPDGDNNCAESCNEAADDCSASDPNGSACSDGLYCTGTETCSAGTCGTSTGDPCPGPNGDGNCSESCDEAGDNCLAADANGSSCSDGTFCNGADTCSAGACSGHAGDPCPGPDGDDNCAESCNEAGDNCTANDTNGSTCTDGTFCNGTDTCSAGACSGHSGNPCPGADGDGNCSESCNEASDNCTASDPNGSTCTDATFCNGTDTCNGGSCSNHTGNPCPGADGDGNCSESCNEASDNCAASDPNGSACNDGQSCNGADSCSGGGCVGSGVCCGTVNFTFTVNSNSGGVFDSAEWPGGTQTQNGIAGCSATIRNPSGNLELVGASGPDAFGVTGFAGFQNCAGTGGEDGDGCQPNSCPPAGIGSCQGARPSCSAALNGSGSARYFVQCTDP